MRPEDLVLVNREGVVIGRSQQVVRPAAFDIHGAVHEARPDVVAVVRCHSIPSKSFAAFGKNLEMIKQNYCW